MNIQDLANNTITITPTEPAIKVGLGNKIILSEKIAKQQLNYQDNDELFLAEAKGDVEGILIGLLPANSGIKTYTFNKGVKSFGDKVVAEFLGGEKSTWDIQIEYDILKLESGRECPIFVLKQSCDGKTIEKDLQERYENVNETKQIVKEDVRTELENQFESEKQIENQEQKSNNIFQL